MRRQLTITALACAVIAAGCSADSYPINPGPGSSQQNPIAVGMPVQAVVLFIDPRPGDTITLLAADPVGLADGATVAFSLSPPVIGPDGSLLIGDRLEELAGGTVVGDSAAPDGPDDTVGIVATVTAQRAGRYELPLVRVRYRVNDGAERVSEGIDTVFTVCADDPAPTSCDEE